MARTNRLVVRDGRYNITARIANRAFLMKNPELRTRIVDWIYGIAAFAGIEVDAWCIMENHIHLCVRVPPVPEQYRLDPSATGPVTEAFSMRPRERRTPRWTPDISETVPTITSAGDTPCEEAVRISIADGVPLVVLPRPETGFTMSDQEMIGRLRRLYSHHSHGAEMIEKRWLEHRRRGEDTIVDTEKEAFCRRMYNVSQYMKTLKQRISEVVNRETNHTGTLWEGRFYSALVGDTARDALMVAAYLGWNPVKAGIAKTPDGWAWSSYAAACDPRSRWHTAAKAGYERCFGKTWNDIHEDFEPVFAEKLPADHNVRMDSADQISKDEQEENDRNPPTIGQLIKTKTRMFERGGYISQDPTFVTRVARNLPQRLPKPSARSIAFFSRFIWRNAG